MCAHDHTHAPAQACPAATSQASTVSTAALFGSRRSAPLRATMGKDNHG